VEAGDVATQPTNPKSVASAHPRGFGAFPRILAKYVREENVIPLPEAIRKLTSLPAAILRLPQRGRIEVGYAADVLVFDPERIRDTATFTEPLSYSVGIDHLLVNGDIVIHDGEMTGSLPGKVLRHRP
jgi:N-acyl-D-aspartate/D-glutamate deacylase